MKYYLEVGVTDHEGDEDGAYVELKDNSLDAILSGLAEIGAFIEGDLPLRGSPSDLATRLRYGTVKTVLTDGRRMTAKIIDDPEHTIGD